MEIKAGYKQTKVGIIPEDWDLETLENLVKRFVNGGTPSTKIDRYWAGTIPWVTGADIIDQKVVVIRRLITKEAVKNSSTNVIESGHLLLVSRTGVGKLAIAPFDVAISQDFTGIYVNTEKLTSEFLYRYLDFNQFVLQNQNQGTSIQGITRETLSNTLIPFPPTLTEQSAITEALSDADTLITSLEKLIAKKKAIKQGAMQELLTGKKRLPGFSGEWEEKQVGVSFTVSGGYSSSRSHLSNEGYCYLHYGDIHGSRKQYIDTEKEYLLIPKLSIDLKRISPASLLENGDIVFVDASEDDEGASKHIVIRNPKNIPYISGLHTIVLKGKDDSITNAYKEYCFLTQRIKRQFKYYSAGTKVTGISKTNIKNIKLILPPTKDEQNAVVNILSDMDSEIEALENKLVKYRLIKQGMMQELLTGRKRLV